VRSFGAADLGLYLVLDPGMTPDPIAAVQSSIGGGVTMVQVRWKDAHDREIVALGDALSPLCRNAGVPLIVNDRLDLALAIGADGVHLGVDDLPLDRARAIAPTDFIVGYSPERDDEIEMAASAGASYLGIGPFADTNTKSDAGKALGPHEFHRRRLLTTLPVVAIGGVSVTNAASARSAGADGIAVVSAILRSEDPGKATRDLVVAFNQS